MLDSYWFAKRQGQDATTVDEIGGTANLGELSDLMYFIKKLYRSLKVPSSRLDPEDSFRGGEDILREELKFARMVMRHQQNFAAGIKKGFITHLKLRHMFQEYEINEEHLHVVFNPPTNFYDLRNNQKMGLKIDTFNNLVGSGKVSESFAKKKILGWKDRDILADRELRRKDSELTWELSQIEAMGPSWKQTLLSQNGVGSPPSSEAGGGGMPPSGGGMPPEFGGGPASTSTEPTPSPEIPTPEETPSEEPS